MSKILCLDSEADDITKRVAEWRKQNVYPFLQGNGHDFKALNGSMAVRNYLKEVLESTDVVFFTGSGHGLTDEFQGTDGDAALKVNDYSPSEVQNKIIHLLSCNTALHLGADVVKNGCTAFFGYDLPFTFYYSHMDLFLTPDATLVFHLSKGKTAKEAFTELEKEYKFSLNKLETQNADVRVIADMETNLAHFRSPCQDRRWGNETASV